MVFYHFFSESCAPPAFQCFDQRCIPRSRVCDGQIDCYGKFHEDEDGCLAETLESCADWYYTALKQDGVYSIHLNTSCKSMTVQCNLFGKIGYVKIILNNKNKN